MLTKIIPGGGSKRLNTINWPTADTCDPVDVSGTATPSEGHFQATELNQLRSELAALKAELETSRAQNDYLIQEALARGKREGDAAARAALEPQLEAELTKLRQMMVDVIAAGPKLRHQTEEDLVRLAVAVARRILHRELTVDTEALIGLVKAAFERLDQREIQLIRTDPDNLNLVRKLAETSAMSRSVKVVSDPALRRGSLIIETTRGQLDASIESQLQEIERGFIDIVQHT